MKSIVKCVDIFLQTFFRHLNVFNFQIPLRVQKQSAKLTLEKLKPRMKKIEEGERKKLETNHRNLSEREKFNYFLCRSNCHEIVFSLSTQNRLSLCPNVAKKQGNNKENAFVCCFYWFLSLTDIRKNLTKWLKNALKHDFLLFFFSTEITG